MAPHIGAYRDDAPLKKVIHDAIDLSEKQKTYYLGVNKADFILKELLSYFYKCKDNNVVLFLSSDHGEGLGLHKFLPIIGHNQQLTYETTYIPLIILDPGERIYCKNKYSTQIDLLPTIVERCFDKYTPQEIIYPGSSLFKKPLNNRVTFHSFYVTKYEDFNFAIIKDSVGQAVEKYLYNPVNGEEFIFNLKRDIHENDTIIDIKKLQYYRDLKFIF
ncbi:MAG: sulfatase-like hydrolase/transferase [Saprospiraceae bacterium]|nr:sulfatase-like hydrolase/transferase [Saprospiraceae bacterium]